MPIWGYFNKVCDSRFVLKMSSVMLNRNSYHLKSQVNDVPLGSVTPAYYGANCKEAVKIEHFGHNFSHNLSICFF